jgi:adenylate cyclase
MNTQEFKRKLTAVFSSDVKGYSRLMGENEAETVRTLTAYRKIMGELIQQHRGRVIDSPGDRLFLMYISGRSIKPSKRPKRACPSAPITL